MADYSYSPQTLPVGTIGGNGFWLMMDCRAWRNGYGASQVPSQNEEAWNTNDQLNRDVEDGTALQKSPPYFEDDMRILFIPSPEVSIFALGMVRYYGLSNTPPYYASGMTGFYAKWLPRTAGYQASFPRGMRHMDSVQFRNLVSFPCMACERIQMGNPGYTDILPGLYEVKVFPDSVNEDAMTCKVSVGPYDNAYWYWTYGDAYLKKNLLCAFGAMKAPYLADEIKVSIAANNWNYHIIPGLKIQLATDLRAGDRFVVAIGHEFTNGRGASEGENEKGCDSYFQPLANLGIQPLLSSDSGKVFYTTNSDRDWSSVATPQWTVFNVSGEVLTGVEFHIWPFVRLQQAILMRPFSQWFMGCNFQTQFPQSSAPYVLTMRNVTGAGANKRCDLTGSFVMDLTVKEVDSVTFVPFSTRPDGKSLKCDGSTLYLWEAGGVYFVLSAEVAEGDRAFVHVRKGCSNLALRNKQACYDDYPTYPVDRAWDGSIDLGHFLFGPLDYPIGTWDLFEGPAENFGNVAVVDKSDGKVGFPCPAHTRLAGQLIRIKNTTNYNADYIVHSDTTIATEIVVNATYVAETLNGATHQLILPGDDCLPESYHTGKMAPQGREFVFPCEEIGERTQWYDHYFSLTWFGYQDRSLASMEDNPHEAALVVTCDDPRYFKAVAVTWIYNPDWTGGYYDADGWYHKARRSFQAMMQVGEIGDAIKFQGMLNVTDIDRSLIVRLNQVPAALAEVYESLGITVED
jgi:hypothetical protein